MTAQRDATIKKPTFSLKNVHFVHRYFYEIYINSYTIYESHMYVTLRSADSHYVQCAR
jgi:hypothetical protein